jgi:glycosyltransferase involved in cell wall biosynthesis
MISCVCVTTGKRPALLAESVGDFCAQTYPDRELLILHDADDATAASVQGLAGGMIRVVRAAPGQSLGALRNQAIAQCRGELICQWDDDDRNHPERLARQAAALQAERAVACYLVDQLHWFMPDDVLCWDDWDNEPYPLNLIQGTVLARREILPPYPALARGEDTVQTCGLLRAAARQGVPVARLRGAGWCSVYRQHDVNVWDAAHHRAISAAKHLQPARLLPLIPSLRARLGDYRPALPPLTMPVGQVAVRL